MSSNFLEKFHGRTNKVSKKGIDHLFDAITNTYLKRPKIFYMATQNSEKEVLSKTKISECKKQKRNKTKKNEENDYFDFTKKQLKSKLQITQQLKIESINNRNAKTRQQTKFIDQDGSLIQSVFKLPKIGKSRIFHEFEEISKGRFLHNQRTPNRRIFMNTEDEKQRQIRVLRQSRIQSRILDNRNFDMHVHEQLKNLNEFKNRLELKNSQDKRNQSITSQSKKGFTFHF